MNNNSIFQSDDNDNVQISRSENIVDAGIKQQPTGNLYMLSEDQKINLNKRLPRGFFLLKKQQYDKLGYMKKAQVDFIDYLPVKKQRKVDLDNPIVKTLSEAWIKKQQQMKKSNRFSLQYTVEGRSRQSEKIKNIIQRFRKLIKNTPVQNFLNKLGYMLALNEIQGQNKKGLLTIDTFKARYMVVLETAKSQSFQTDVIAQTQQMIEQFLCYVEQARKAQFQNNIQSIQKSIDKITRYLSSQPTEPLTLSLSLNPNPSTNKSQGNWYIKKRKKGERTDQYSEKQILYFGDLIKKLPPAYLIGIWEIVYEKPFIDQKRNQTINLLELGGRKLREIQIYVKGKLSQLMKSRQRKRDKILQKRREKRKMLRKSIKNQPKIKQNKIKQQNLDNALIDDFSVPADKNKVKQQQNVQNEDKQAKSNIQGQAAQQYDFMGAANQNQNENENGNAPVDLKAEIKVQNFNFMENNEENAVIQQNQNKNENQNQNYEDEAQEQYDDEIDDQQLLMEEEYNSSDSSLITDQEQSDF